MNHQPPVKRHPMRHIARFGDWILDPSILFSFDHVGYLRHSAQFDPTDLDKDMSNRICLVSGANSGLGLATVRALAARNATVWLLCRNLEKGHMAADSIRKETGNHNLVVAPLDLTDRTSIESFAAGFALDRIDVLIHNAGVLLNEKELTPSGLEKTLATNLVGPLALTAKLLDRLKKGRKARIIWVSSGGMYLQKLDLERLHTPPIPFNGVKAYAQTKRAMALLSRQMAEKLKPHAIAVHCMHPGWADTPGVKTSLPKFYRAVKPILRTPEGGADTSVWLAVCDKAQDTSGLYWFDRKPRSPHLLPGTKSSVEDEREFWNAIHKWADLDSTQWEKP